MKRVQDVINAVEWWSDRAPTAGLPRRTGQCAWGRSLGLPGGHATAYRSAVEETAPGSDVPVILVVDGEGSSSVTAAALQDRYGRSYDITVVETPTLGRDLLDRAANRGIDVALVLAQRVDGVQEVLDAARRLHPHARRGFLLKWYQIRSERQRRLPVGAPPTW